MKSLKLFLSVIMMIRAVVAFAETVEITVSGHVTDMQNQQPVANHAVIVTLYPDSLNLGSVDSLYTDASGYYSVVVTAIDMLGMNPYLTASTFDCAGTQHSLDFFYSGATNIFNADFTICTDSINPPVGCSNYIMVSGVQALTVSFGGYVENQQQADYTWEFGDGTSGTGQFPVHTYGIQGVYTVTLFTVTSDSCADNSQYTLVLQDSVPNGCENFFTYDSTGYPLERVFQAYSLSQYYTYYSWNFGDPASGAANTSDLIYASHVFSAEGDYVVTLSTIDSTGCSYTSTQTVTVLQGNTGYLSIYGNITAGNAFLDEGYASLYRSDSLGMFGLVQIVTVDSAGYYAFYNLNEGAYLVLAAPSESSVFYGSYLPTYYGDAFMWEDALPIVLGDPQSPYNINLISLDSTGYGDGLISGQLVTDGKSVLPSQQEVLLLNATDEPVALTVTDDQGVFGFAYLPFGVYKINPVITGFTTYPAVVELSGASNSTMVVMEINGHTITGIEEAKSQVISPTVYPNPTSDHINVVFKPGDQRPLLINIVDITGRTVVSAKVASQEFDAPVEVHTEGLPAGIYSLQIIRDRMMVSSARFVKK